MAEPVWKEVGFGLYEVNNLGQVRNWRYGRPYPIKPYVEEFKGHEYLYVRLYNGGERKNLSLANLVATHFVENPTKSKIVKHIDGNLMNNHAENLKWQMGTEYGNCKETCAVCGYTVKRKYLDTRQHEESGWCDLKLAEKQWELEGDKNKPRPRLIDYAKGAERDYQLALREWWKTQEERVKNRKKRQSPMPPMPVRSDFK
jgi:hypothetical protein